jgi:hypothetical protein
MGLLQGCQVHHSTTQSRASNSALLFDTEDWDHAAFHSTVTNTSRLTAPVTGYYMVHAYGATSAGAAGQYGLYFKVNGAAVGPADFRDSATTADKKFSVSGMFFLNATDYIEVFVNHSGTITWAAGIFSIFRLG